MHVNLQVLGNFIAVKVFRKFVVLKFLYLKKKKINSDPYTFTTDL